MSVSPLRGLGDRPAAATTEELARRWRHERDAGARELLVRRFTPLARRLARRYDSAQEPLEDLVQVALVGLIGAIDRFDPDRGVPFEAFAIPTVLGELKRHFRSTGWSAHVPRALQELSLRVDRVSRQVTGDLGRSPTPSEISQRLELGLEDVLCALEAGAAHHAASLDTPTPARDDEDAAVTVGERVGTDEGGFALTEAKLSLAATFARLPYAERRALRLRIEGDLKQSEVAAIMGCSQMHVSRLLRSAAARVEALLNP